MSVEETLAAAAKATEAAAQATPKKERVKKGAVGAPDGRLPGEDASARKATKAPRQAKQYPQANEDGTQKFEEDGVTPVMGPKATAYKAPKAPREKKAPGLKAVDLLLDGQPVKLSAIQNDAVITVHKDLGSREGSKRAERAKAFEGAKTVQDFFANKGASKDLLRHLKTGAITLDVGGKAVTVVGKAPAAPAETPAE